MSRKYEICWHHHSDQEITMKRLIIHPRDHTTDFLTALYEGPRGQVPWLTHKIITFLAIIAYVPSLS